MSAPAEPAAAAEQAEAAAAACVESEACAESDACADGPGDLGWGLAIVARVLRENAAAAVADLPGGPRGYLVLATVARGRARSQLALAQACGVDKTVMTYLLDDLERAGLLERR